MTKTRNRRRVSARKRAETHKTGFERTTLDVGSDVKFFSLDKVGTRRVDVIPYKVGKGNPYCETVGELFFERTFYEHRDIGVNQEKFVCPAKTVNKRCPICDYINKLNRDPNADPELIKALAPRQRQLFNVIDIEDRDEGVQIWDISFHLFGKLLDAEIRNADEDEEYEFFADLDGGQTLKLGITDKVIGKGKPFYEVETIGFKKRQEEYDEEILEQTHCLDDILRILDYDKLKAIFLQTDDSDEDSEEEEKPKRKRRTTKKKDTLTADSKGLKKYMEVEHEKLGVCRILNISGDGTSLILEDEDEEVHKGVGVDEVLDLSKDREEKPKAKKSKAKPKPADGDDDIPFDDDEEPEKKTKPEDDEEKWDNWDDDED